MPRSKPSPEPWENPPPATPTTTEDPLAWKKSFELQAAESRAEMLERLLRNLLDEVSIRDGLGAISKIRCTGCVKKSPLRKRACEEARGFLDG